MATTERELVDKAVETALYNYGRGVDEEILKSFRSKYWSKNNNTNDVRSMTYDMFLDFPHFYGISISEAFNISGITFSPLREENAQFLNLAEKVNDQVLLSKVESSLKRILPDWWQNVASLTPSKRILEFVDRSTVARRRHLKTQSLKTAWGDRTKATTMPTKDLPAIAEELGLPINWILNTQSPTGIYTRNVGAERVLNLFMVLQPYAKSTLLEGLEQF